MMTEENDPIRPKLRRDPASCCIGRPSFVTYCAEKRGPLGRLWIQTRLARTLALPWLVLPKLVLVRGRTIPSRGEEMFMNRGAKAKKGPRSRCLCA
jgi:hypothetical protein